MLAKNLRAGRGEIDLVVALDGGVVAVEVKTRIEEDPADQLTAEKRRRMREAAAAIHPRPGRLDLITVRLDTGGATVRWIRGVT